MKYIFCIFHLLIAGISNAQDSLVFAPRQTLDLSIDTFENQKLGSFEVSIKLRKIYDWGEDHCIVLSKYGEKTDTLWPRKTNLMRFQHLWYVKNIWLFGQDKIIMIMMCTNGNVIYMVYKWDGNFWDFTDKRFVGFVPRGYNIPDITIQAINYNKLIAIQGDKKELIEYDLSTKTEKRTEIKK